MGFMTELAETLAGADAALAEIAVRTLGGRELESMDDARLLEVGALAAAISRRADAVLVAVTEQVDERCRSPRPDERLSHRLGCRDADELLRRVTRASGRTVTGLRRAARAFERPLLPSSGELRDSAYPAMRAALADGAVGIDGALAVLGPLEQMGGRAGWAEVAAADGELAAAARGEGADGAPAASADDLRDLARVWAVYLDADGAEPREEVAMRTRGVTLGRAHDGVVPVRGALLPEVAGQLVRLCDAQLNPKAEASKSGSTGLGPVFTDSEDADEAPHDTRTRPQRLHDALAAILAVAARSPEMPTLGGAAPTLVVTARADDLRTGRGWAHVSGSDEPISLSAARHVACTGGIQRVFHDDAGRILSLEVADRVFTHHQRKAIYARDGGCIIPGCRVPAEWCEIHHVVEAARGGPTHTDNGVAVCWFHHRTLDTSGWCIRMHDGVPEVRAPAWWDPERRWRPVTRSPVRMRERVAARRRSATEARPGR